MKAKNPAAVSLGRLGGTARASALTPAQRSEIARKAGEKGGWPKGTKRGPSPLKGQKRGPRKPA